MPATRVPGRQVLDGDITRADLNIGTVGSAVIRKAVQGAGIILTSTGADAGTGDVTVALDTPTNVKLYLGLDTSSMPQFQRLVLLHPTQADLYFLSAAGGNGWIVGRSSQNTNLNDFFFYDWANNAFRMTLGATGGVCIGGVVDPGAGSLVLGSAMPGTTPWASAAFLLMGNGNLMANKTIAANNYFYMSNNMIFDGGNWRAVSTDKSSTYYQEAGDHRWVTCVSQTAGAVPAFSEKMRLYNGGGLCVGGTMTDPGGGNLRVGGGALIVAAGGMFFQISNSFFGSDWCVLTGDSGLTTARHMLSSSPSQGTVLNSYGGGGCFIDLRFSNGAVDPLFRMYPTGGLYFGPVAGAADPGANVLRANGGLSCAAFFLPGTITPSQITSDQHNYAPTGFATATTLRLDTNAARSISGLAGGAAGRVIRIVNVGANNLRLLNNDAGSTAGNRFQFADHYDLGPNASILVIYDATSSRWRPTTPTVSDGDLGVNSASIIPTQRAAKLYIDARSIIGSVKFNDSGGSIANDVYTGIAGVVTAEATGVYKLTISGQSDTEYQVQGTCGDKEDDEGYIVCLYPKNKTTSEFYFSVFGLSSRSHESGVKEITIWISRPQ